MNDIVEVRRVLANWIAQAYSGDGQLADGINPHEWIADQFLKWWRSQVEDDLADVEGAIAASRAALQDQGGWSNQKLGEAMHELVHADDALASLRAVFGFLDEGNTA